MRMSVDLPAQGRELWWPWAIRGLPYCDPNECERTLSIDSRNSK